MGGHTQFGEFESLMKAIKCWVECVYQFEGINHLTLACGEIKYDKYTQKYKIAMRFVK